MRRAYIKQKLAFYVLNANVVVNWTSTTWSILQGLKIINVLCFGCRIILFMVSQPWRRRSVCLKSLVWETEAADEGAVAKLSIATGHAMQIYICLNI